MNAYLEALKAAHRAGYHVPELVSCYFREDGFTRPRYFVTLPH